MTTDPGESRERDDGADGDAAATDEAGGAGDGTPEGATGPGGAPGDSDASEPGSGSGGERAAETVDPDASTEPTGDAADPTRPPDGFAGRETEPDSVDAPSADGTAASAEAVRAEILDDVRSFFERAAAGEAPRTDVIAGAESSPEPGFVADRWFDLSFLDDGELVEWQWVREPFSLVSVRYRPDDRTYRYHVTEPALDGFERYVRRDLTGTIRNSLMYESLENEEDRTAVFAAQVQSVVAEHAATVDAGSVQKLYYYFLRDFLGYGRIDPLMRDGDIEDISCDGEEVPVFVYHRRFRDLRTNVSFDGDALNSLAVRLAHRAGKHLSVSSPLVDASLADGSRIQLTLGGDISQRGTNFTIRKFSDVPLTPVDLIRSNTFSVDQMAYFWLAIENNMSLLFAGGTGSGKTTSLNAVSFFVPPDSKVVSIEDTREITLPHDNWVQSVTRESAATSGRGEVTTYTLLQAALRQRPEYILVGEIRTEQRVALTFFQAIGTGHTAYTTVHADSVEAALARLENPPLSVPAQLVQNLDIISVQRQVYQERDRVRRNEAVAELVPTDDGEVVPNVVFERDPATDTHERPSESRVLQRVADQRGWDADRIAIEESRVLRRVADRRGWNPDRLRRELDRRREVLEYLVGVEGADYETVARTVHAFSRAPDAVLAELRAEEADLEAIAELAGR